MFYAETGVFEDCAFGGRGVCEGQRFTFRCGNNLSLVLLQMASKTWTVFEVGDILWYLVDEDEGEEALVETETDTLPAGVQPHQVSLCSRSQGRIIQALYQRLVPETLAARIP